MEKLFWEKQINFFWKVEIGQRYPFMFLLDLDEKIKTVWVDFNWFDMRSPRLGSLWVERKHSTRGPAPWGP